MNNAQQRLLPRGRRAVHHAVTAMRCVTVAALGLTAFFPSLGARGGLTTVWLVVALAAGAYAVTAVEVRRGKVVARLVGAERNDEPPVRAHLVRRLCAAVMTFVALTVPMSMSAQLPAEASSAPGLLFTFTPLFIIAVGGLRGDD